MSADLIESFSFFIPHLCPYPLVLRATDEKPGTVWQRVSNSSTSDFFFFFLQAITRNDLIFYESSAMKSEKVTTRKQFIDAGGELSHDFMQDVPLGNKWCEATTTKKKGGVLSVSLVIAVAQVPRLEISKLHLSAGICWQLDLFGRVICPGCACAMPPSLPHSLHPPLNSL